MKLSNLEQLISLNSKLQNARHMQAISVVGKQAHMVLQKANNDTEPTGNIFFALDETSAKMFQDFFGTIVAKAEDAIKNLDVELD